MANKVLAETFQHSGETISRHFNNVLRAIVMLKDEYLTMPPNNAVMDRDTSDGNVDDPPTVATEGDDLRRGESLRMDFGLEWSSLKTIVVVANDIT
ncbi:hypothetical protein ACMD2_15947 [Ananas comosus]|uniref:DUF8040 domain-containing protein n=1 Tax=Ananas comosus TaxID=4615 RepID=A0A199VSK6_ANACO|nr:hypothetical protein ACMD2_15947 [Ananas comosus]